MLINSLDSTDERRRREREVGREETGEMGMRTNLANLAIDGCTPLGDNVLFIVALRLGHMIQTHDGLCG